METPLPMARTAVALFRVRFFDGRGGMVCRMHRVEQRGCPERLAHHFFLLALGGTLNVLMRMSVFAGVFAFAGCGNNNQRPAESAIAEAPSTEGGSATDSIAESRCARESRCDNVGADKKFSSMEDCILRVRTDWKDELSSRECPSGIDETQLNECLNEIREEDCSSPFDTLERVAACTADQICAD